MKAFDTISASFATQHRTFAKTRIKLAGLIDIQARNDACRAGGDGICDCRGGPQDIDDDGRLTCQLTIVNQFGKKVNIDCA